MDNTHMQSALIISAVLIGVCLLIILVKAIVNMITTPNCHECGSRFTISSFFSDGYTYCLRCRHTSPKPDKPKEYEPWVCDTCKAGYPEQCALPHACAVGLERRIMAAEARMDSIREDGP